MNDSVTLPPPPASAPPALSSLAAADEASRDFIRASKAKATVTAYRSDWKQFSAWCEAADLEPLPAPPSTVRRYLASQAARLKPASLARHLTSIGMAHLTAGYENPVIAPEVAATMAGIRREKGIAPAQKLPTSVGQLKQMAALRAGSLLGARNRALLQVGFAGAFRRSELVALAVEDVAFVEQGAVLTLRRSKTDQEGAGRAIAIPHGPTVTALEAWLAAAGLTQGPLFRSVDRHGRLGASLSDRAVANILKAAAEAIGLDPALYSGHSLRAGLATSAALAGSTHREIMAQTGHKSVEMVSRYVRVADMWRENVAGKLGV